MSQGVQIIHKRSAALVVAVGAAIVLVAIVVAMMLIPAANSTGGQEVFGKPDWSKAQPMSDGRPINNGEKDIVCPGGKECGE